jgi:hypothetical protein
MARNKNASRGQSSNTQRRVREEMFVKTLNRKKNHEGTNARRKANP